jgi:hypothetical protein
MGGVPSAHIFIENLCGADDKMGFPEDAGMKPRWVLEDSHSAFLVMNVSTRNRSSLTLIEGEDLQEKFAAFFSANFFLKERFWRHPPRTSHSKGNHLPSSVAQIVVFI